MLAIITWMLQTGRRELLSVPNVADGNPATALALQQEAQSNGIPLEGITELSLASLPAKVFHRLMTRIPSQAQEYVGSSEDMRAGILGQAFAIASFAEFAVRSRAGHDAPPARWNVVEEHPLLGASIKSLRRLNITDVRLVVPDAYPKESAVLAAQKHPGAVVSVWSHDSENELAQRGLNTQLTKPYFLDAFRPDGNSFRNGGLPVVAKSSGSGLPAEWRQALELGLGRTDVEWALHTPQGRLSAGSAELQTGREARLRSFYEDIGGQTRLLICYPSELVSLACDLRDRGVPMWMMTLPPRGAHEQRNLEFAVRHGLVTAELAINKAVGASAVEGLAQIEFDELPDVIKDLGTPKWSPNITGDRPFWQAS